MRVYDIIDKKKRGGALTEEEIRFIVNGYTEGSIPDYQMSALLMAIWFRGMNSDETRWLTMAMAESGDTLDLSAIEGIKVDKHSTGGIGDKTTLIIGPIMASLGVPVAKMSGRGLGATGGTIDKLDSIPGFSSQLSDEQFIAQVNTVGFADAAQTKNLVPADKLMYALRDVTATVDNIALIASSIMSKKLASGADAILLDVKCGSGAFMRDLNSAEQLAETMIDVGESCGRKTAAIISDMNEPLGRAVGNSLEVLEAVEVLKGGGEERLKKVCMKICEEMINLSGIPIENSASSMVEEAVKSGRALEKFKEFVRAQGGDASFTNDASKLKQALYTEAVKAPKSGYLSSCNAELVGSAACVLGAGRESLEDVIDPSAGIIVYKKLGDYVEEGDTIAVLHTDDEQRIGEAKSRILRAYKISEKAVNPSEVIFKVLKK